MNVCYLTTTGKSTAHRNQKVQMTVSNAVSVQKENLVRISLVFFFYNGEKTMILSSFKSFFIYYYLSSLFYPSNGKTFSFTF